MSTVIDQIIFGLILLGILIELGYIFYQIIKMDSENDK